VPTAAGLLNLIVLFQLLTLRPQRDLNPTIAFRKKRPHDADLQGIPKQNREVQPRSRMPKRAFLYHRITPCSAPSWQKRDKSLRLDFGRYLWQPYLYMSLVIDIDREPNGEWIASVRELQGVIARDRTRDGALRAAQVLAFRALADQLQREELPPFAAFSVNAVEGPASLAIRERIQQTMSSLQDQAQATGASNLSEEEIEDEIRATRIARKQRAISDPRPRNASGR
jgi:predicted RNase H-like HicB family nuclease